MSGDKLNFASDSNSKFRLSSFSLALEGKVSTDLKGRWAGINTVHAAISFQSRSKSNKTGDQFKSSLHNRDSAERL